MSRLFKLVIMILLIGCNEQASYDVIKIRGESDKIFFSKNLIDDVPYKNTNNTYNMVIEIPAGTVEKWEVEKSDGQVLRLQYKKGKPRIINYLAYPGNYGFIPQTVLSKGKGGDGDPIDVLLLSHSVKRGSIQKVRLIGALKYLDRGEVDDKLIAISTSGPFKEIKDISDLMVKYPGAVQIIKLWFDGYKKQGKMIFMGYAKSNEIKKMVRKSHKQWEKSRL